MKQRTIPPPSKKHEQITNIKNLSLATEGQANATHKAQIKQ